MYQPNDKFAQKAKAEGFRSRAVYKLDELNQKYSLFKTGQKVLDLGAAPGSWLQYCAKVVGPKGLVVGVDISPIEHLKLPNLKIIQHDIFSPQLLKSLPQSFEVILSDAAPATSGISLTDSSRSLQLAEQAYKIAQQKLVPGGNFCTKIFMSPEAEIFFQQIKKSFLRCHRFKPHASRLNSKEIYFIGLKKIQSTK